MVLSEARSTCLMFGMRLIKNEYDEFVVYPVGSSRNDPCAYFTMDMDDAVNTAKEMGVG